MQNDTSKFVVNIIPLQNVNSNTSGLNATTNLANQVVALRQMINTDTKTVYANNLAAFTTGASIGVLSPLNLCNVGITSNSLPAFSSSSVSSITTLANGSNSMQIYNTNSLMSTVMDFTTASNASSILSLTQGGNLSIGGICYAQQFVTLSDMNAKTGVREWRAPVLADLQKIRPYIFTYADSPDRSLGLLAQEVGEVFPSLVKEGVKGVYVNYDGMVALLIKAVQELSLRVSTLEGKHPLGSTFGQPSVSTLESGP
jgi:hypothetical protein